MSSAWGNSWGRSWGQSWGSVGNFQITDTDILQLPVDCVLAGQQQIRDRYRTWEVPQARRTEKTTVSRSGARRLGGTKPSFTVTTGKRGYD